LGSEGVSRWELRSLLNRLLVERIGSVLLLSELNVLWLLLLLNKRLLNLILSLERICLSLRWVCFL
jgi:hypothetical protein